MFENVINFFKKLVKSDNSGDTGSKNAAKERLHLVLIQDRASVSADFLEVMKQEIIDVIKKYIDIDEGAIDVRLTNNTKEDGTVGAPALYANFPIKNVKVKGVDTDNKGKKEPKAKQKSEGGSQKTEKAEGKGNKAENEGVKESKKEENKPKEEKEDKVKNPKMDDKADKKEDVKTDKKVEEKKVEIQEITVDDMKEVDDKQEAEKVIEKVVNEIIENNQDE